MSSSRLRNDVFKGEPDTRIHYKDLAKARLKAENNLNQIETIAHMGLKLDEEDNTFVQRYFRDIIDEVVNLSDGYETISTALSDQTHRSEYFEEKTEDLVEYIDILLKFFKCTVVRYFDTEGVREWLRTNIVDDDYTWVYVNKQAVYYIFQKKEDAALFKLKWDGELYEI